MRDRLAGVVVNKSSRVTQHAAYSDDGVRRVAQERRSSPWTEARPPARPVRLRRATCAVGIGVVAIGTAAYLWLSHRSASPAAHGTALRVQALTGGAAAVYSGSF